MGVSGMGCYKRMGDVRSVQGCAAPVLRRLIVIFVLESGLLSRRTLKIDRVFIGREAAFASIFTERKCSNFV